MCTVKGGAESAPGHVSKSHGKVHLDGSWPRPVTLRKEQGNSSVVSVSRALESTVERSRRSRSMTTEYT
jgi:hypothetical protein